MQALALNTQDLTFSFLKNGPQEIPGQSLIRGGSFDFVKMMEKPQISLLLNSLFQPNLAQHQLARSLGREAQMLLQLGAKVFQGLPLKNSLNSEFSQGLEKFFQKNSLEKDLGQALEIGEKAGVSSNPTSNNNPQLSPNPESPRFSPRLVLKQNLQEITKKLKQSKSTIQQWVFGWPEKAPSKAALGRWAALGLSGTGLGVLCLLGSMILN